MRFAVVLSLIGLVACGGSKKPADAPETPSAETSASPSTDIPAASESAAAASPSVSASEAPPPEAPPSQPSPSHPVPNVTGSIDGKAFAPKMARINQSMQKDGRIVVTVDERTDCGGDPKPGESILTMIVPWEDGYKQDLGSLKRANRNGSGEISFARVGASGKKEVSTTFKPTGRVTIVKTPTDQGATGKMVVDLTSGDYMLSGNLDIQMCAAAKNEKDAPKSATSAPKSPTKPAAKKKK